MFGYFQSAAEEHEEAAGVGEEVSIFTVSKRRRVGEAAGMPGQLFFLWSTFYNYILEKLVFKLLIYSVLQRNDLFALMGYLSIFILYNVRFPIATILQGIKLVATPCNVCALFHRWTATFQRHKKEPSSYGIVQWVFRMWFCF